MSIRTWEPEEIITKDGVVKIPEAVRPLVGDFEVRLASIEDQFQAYAEETNNILLQLATHMEAIKEGKEPHIPSKAEITQSKIGELPMSKEWNPKRSNMLIWDSEEKGVSWWNLYKGSKIFLLCSGPSLNDLDLSLLNQRGIVTMGLNNVWCKFKPDMWLGFDTPGRFHPEGWMDPSILKFVPWHNRSMRLREITPKGDFFDAGISPMEIPNCWFVSNNVKVDIDNWLTEESVNWGGELEGSNETRFRSTFLGAIRLLYYLGFQEVYLLGADWNMSTDEGVPGYAFDEHRDARHRNGNNRMYAWTTEFLRRLQPQFKETGFRIFNCNPDSHLELFPYMSFESAVTHAATPEIEQTRGWYGGESPNAVQKGKKGETPANPPTGRTVEVLEETEDERVSVLRRTRSDQ